MDLKGKIYGALFGIAIGDALGLGTEFMTRDEISLYYPRGLNSYSDIIRDAHRCQWQQGDWTNDTELIVRLVDSIADKERIDIRDFAGRVIDWFKSDPADVVACMRWVLSTPGWIDNPEEVASEVWFKINRFEASNEALPRSIITAIVSDDPADDTKHLIAMTHPDSRCVVSGLVLNKMASCLLWEDRIATFEELREICLQHDTRVLPWVEMAYGDSLDPIEIDDEDTLWYTRKAMAISLWTIIHCSSPEEILNTVVMQGGDADTNGACAMGLAGIKYGYHALPTNLVNTLREKDRLENSAANFTDAVRKIKNL